MAEVSTMKRWGTLHLLLFTIHHLAVNLNHHRQLFNPLQEIHRAGVTVKAADVELFGWQPRQGVVTVGAHLTVVEKRCALALALAHRALGHLGNDYHQDREASDLAVDWMLPPPVVASSAATQPDVAALAEEFAVSELVMKTRLGQACTHVPNIEMFRGNACDRCAGQRRTSGGVWLTSRTGGGAMAQQAG